MQFRNCISKNLDFKDRIIALCGPNGIGKTNILDAIHYLCFTKSYFSKSDSVNVSFGAHGFRIQGEFSIEKDFFTASCILRENGKKEMILNGDLYSKFSDHVGKFPVVVVTPDDTELIMGSSDIRRKYLDMVISQIDPEYLRQLILYNKILQQRNSLLKQLFEKGKFDESLLSVMDQQMVKPALYIHSKRKSVLKEFIPLVLDLYKEIAGKEEHLTITYQSQLNQDDIFLLLQNSRHKDMATQRTSIGPHKDELELLMGKNLLKTVASQGQRKSLLFSLKLAEFKILKINKKIEPILLLDDVFEKLDESRMEKLLKWTCRENQGQVFLTDTHLNRLESTLGKLSIPFQLHHLS